MDTGKNVGRVIQALHFSAIMRLASRLEKYILCSQEEAERWFAVNRGRLNINDLPVSFNFFLRVYKKQRDGSTVTFNTTDEEVCTIKPTIRNDSLPDLETSTRLH